MRRLLLASWALAAACTDCDHRIHPIEDAGYDDVVADTRKDVVLIDGSDPRACDGGPAEDWPGWRRLVEFDPCCPIDVPVDVEKALSPWAWKACETGTPSCQQLDIPKYLANGEGALGGATISGDGRFLALGRYANTNHDSEHDVYDVQLGQPVAAWRSMGKSYCSAGPFLATKQIAVLADRGIPPNLVDTAFAFGSLPDVMTQPKFAPLSPPPQTLITDIGFLSVSDALIAFDVRPAYQIVRLQPGDTSYVKTPPDPPLLYPHAHDTDVFAWNEKGTDGWSREFRVNPDGSVTLYRAAPQTHVRGLATDATSVWWAECSGGNNQVDPNKQPNISIWAAPYTADPSTLASTAVKVATLDGMTTACPKPGDAVAFNGLYSFGDYSDTFLVRKADGAVKKVSLMPDVFLGYPAYISSNEIWSVARIYPGGKLDPAAVFVKISLPAW